MKALGCAVGVFAVLAAAVGVYTGDAIMYLVAAAALICAFTTYKSASISVYLKIFVAFFSTATVLSGLALCIRQLGFWPETYKDYAKLESVTLTFSVFSIVVFAASFLPLIKEITRIADLYFSTTDQGTMRLWPFKAFSAPERRIAIAMIVFLIALNQLEVLMQVQLSFFNRDFFNALQHLDGPAFWHQMLWVLPTWGGGLVTCYVIEYVVQSMLTIRWRRWLTNYYIGRWLGDHAHYKMSLTAGEADNPDQRIAEDVGLFIDDYPDHFGLYSFSITLFSKMSSLIYFSIILWSASSKYTIPGTNFVIPGYLFWVSLLYAGFGTWIAHLIGRSLAPKFFERQKVEANFRFALARIREYSEQIALLAGERTERAALGGRFTAIVQNYLQLVNTRKKLLAFRQAFDLTSSVTPFIITAPFYFAKKIELGDMTQTSEVFQQVSSSLTFFVNYYTGLAQFRAVVARLTSFDKAINAAEIVGASGPHVRLGAPKTPLSLERIHIALPDGREIVEAEHLAFEPGQSALIAGPSGSGKSTLLRTIAGVWPYGSGEIDRPTGAKMLVLPQRPYIPNASLRAAVCYPAAADAYTDAEINDALDAVRLSPLKARLQETGVWSQRLSGGEQQRLAIARALLAKPDWLLLDEATAALDEKLEAELYLEIARRLPDTTIVSIGHRSTLLAMHARRIEMRPAGEGRFVPQDTSQDTSQEMSQDAIAP